MKPTHPQRRYIRWLLPGLIGLWVASAAGQTPHQPSTASPQPARKRIVIGTEAAYPPYSYLSEDGRPIGYNVDIIQAVAQVTGLDVEIRLRPWSQIRLALEAGNIDAICGMYASPERDKLVDFSLPVTVVHHGVFIPHGAEPIHSAQDLKGKEIIVMQNDIMHDWVVRLNLGGRLLPVKTISEGLRMLAEGKGDCGLFARLPANHWIAEEGLSGKVELSLGGLVPSRSCFAVREGDLELAERLSEGLSIIQQSGRADQIRSRWLQPSQSPPKEASARRFVPIGILACRGRQATHRLWGLTADYLTHRIPGYSFQIVPLGFDEVIPAIKAGRVEFALVNPALYVGLEKQFGASRIVTLVGRDHRGPSSKFGSALICRADNQSLRFAEDIRSRRVAAVAETSFGGWLAFLREMKRRSIDVADLGHLQFTQSQDEVVLQVLSGKADAGVVRGSLLDWMSSEGKIQREQLRVLDFSDVDPEVLTGETTRRYPQWPLAELPHTEEGLAEKVASALLAMPADSPGARAGQTAGWTVPTNYQSVHDLLEDLRAWPYDNASVTSPTLSSQHSVWLALLFGACVGLGAWGIWTFRLNRRLRLALRQRERAERATATAKEAAETANRDLLAMNLQLEQAIQQANVLAQKAEEAATTKSEFLANMSHEIRTPLTAILGYAELLSDPDCQEDQRHEQVMEISRNGRHLLMLINDILDLSKIEAGKFDVESRPVTIRELVSDVAGMMRIRAQQRGIALLLQFEPDLPEVLLIDEHRLRQILVNLLGNAVKFTEHGSVRVESRFLPRRQEDTSALELRIIDTGVGMSPDAIRRIGAPFIQADASTTRKFGGTGLGLAITSRLVDLLSGNLQIESSLGEGSTFTVILPAAKAKAPKIPELPEPESNPLSTATDCQGDTPPNLDSLKVLIVEDNPVNQKLFSALLSKAGAEIRLASNGQEAIDQARHEHFDVILMDMQMPVMDGYEATRELRRGGYEKPIIALTAHALREDRDKCLQAGCDDYLTKPVNRQVVLETILRHIPGRCGASGRS